MLNQIRAIPALMTVLLLAAVLSTAPVQRAQAVTLNYGDTTAASNCTLADACVFSGAMNVGYFAGGLADHFYASLTGTPGQTLSWTLNPTVSMDLITSGLGNGLPIDQNAGGGSAYHVLTAGQTSAIDLMFGSNGYLTVNLAVLSGAVADAGGLFSDNGFALVTDSITGSSLFGDPIVVGPSSCSSGATWNGTSCNGGAGGSSGGGGTGSGPGVIPVPAAGWLLLVGIGGLWSVGRRKTRTA